MNLAGWAMRFRPVVITFVFLMTVWGVVSYLTMPRREDPEFTIRTCVVSTSWPGAPTVKVEELITDKLEEALDGIEEVDRIRSKSINGLSTVFVDLEDRLSPDEIPNVWDKVRARVEQVQMPDKDIKPVVDDEFGDTAVLVLGIFQKPLDGQSIHPNHRYTPRELEVFADQVRDAIRLLPGVAKVEKYGVLDEAIYIETDLGTWSKLALITKQLRQLVENRNIVAPGGSIDTDVGRFTVKPGGEFNAVSEIESIVAGAVQSGDSVNQVLLRDLGLKVRRDYVDPPSAICRFTDESGTYSAVTLGVTMKSGSNIIDVCERAKQRISDLAEKEQALPRDLAVVPVSDQSENVSAKINDVINNVFMAILIVVVVVFVFVGLRTSIVMAANIPVVVLASLAVITLFGVQLEQISLASIIIALGLLVDNAVQVCDQTRTNILSGMKPVPAAIAGARTLSLPMLSGTLTTVAAFFPMLLALEGGGKEYVYSLPVTLSTTLLISWLLAMSFCVILAAALIRSPKNPDQPTAPLPWLSDQIESFVRRIFTKRTKGKGDVATAVRPERRENIFLVVYGWIATWALKTKFLTIAAAIGLLVATLSLKISSEFFPKDRRDQFSVNVVLPETSTIEQTNQVVRDVESIIRKLSPTTDETGQPIERLRAMRSMIGQGGARWALASDPPSPASNVAEIVIRTTDGRLTPDFVKEVQEAINTGHAELGIQPIVGARVVTKELSLGPPAAPLVLRIAGDGFADIGQLRSITQRIKNLIQDQPETWDVNDTWGVDGFQLSVDVNQDKANLAGVTNSNVADTLNSYFSGLRLSTFREGDHQIPVYFRLESGERNDLQALRRVFVEVDSEGSEKLPLDSIASVRSTWQPAKIERRNLNRTIEVRSEIYAGFSGNDVVNRIWDSEEMNQIKADLPNGFSIQIGGSMEESQKSSVQMLTSFGISFLMIILILIVQYNGWSKPIVILSTLPLSLIGALFGLWLTNNGLGFMPQLGLLSLFGIVLNTGIIFIEFADILISEKAQEKSAAGDADGPICGLTIGEFRECLVAAGKQRMLPIFLTTATTIGGLLPLATSAGPLWEGMAWLMIFGLIVATALTLIVVPALYAVLVETFRVPPIEVTSADSSG